MSVPKTHYDKKYCDSDEEFGANNPSLVKAYEEAKTMLDVLLKQLYTRNGLGIKKELTLFKRRQLAVVRSKYDQPIARIGQFLRAVIPESLDADYEPVLEDMIIEFYSKNYKWIDMPTATWIVSQIYSSNYESKGEIFYDRHFRKGLPSEGDSGEPYESISFSSDIGTSELMGYLDWHRDYIDVGADDGFESFGHWDLLTIRKIIIHSLYYRYCKYHYDGTLTHKEILKVYEKVFFEDGRKLPEDINKRGANPIIYDEVRLRQETLEVDKEMNDSPFKQALELFEKDFSQNRKWYNENGISFDVEEDDCGIILQDKRLLEEATAFERFELEYDLDNNQFIATKTKQNSD